MKFNRTAFPQSDSFLKAQTQAAHSNANKERISSMINKNKTSIRSSLSLSGGLIVHYVSEDTYWCPISMENTIRIAKNSEKKIADKYNGPHSSK